MSCRERQREAKRVQLSQGEVRTEIGLTGGNVRVLMLRMTMKGNAASCMLFACCMCVYDWRLYACAREIGSLERGR